jgi:hypothetical protein
MNIKTELELKITNTSIKCAFIDFDDNENCKTTVLKIEYTKEEFDKFMKELNFEYNPEDNYLYGTVWFEDNTFMNFDEYNLNKDCTNLNTSPVIPNICK